VYLHRPRDKQLFGPIVVAPRSGRSGTCADSISVGRGTPDCS